MGTIDLVIQDHLSDASVMVPDIPLAALTDHSDYFKKLCTGDFKEAGQRTQTVRLPDLLLPCRPDRFSSLGMLLAQWLRPTPHDLVLYGELLECWGFTGLFDRCAAALEAGLDVWSNESVLIPGFDELLLARYVLDIVYDWPQLEKALPLFDRRLVWHHEEEENLRDSVTQMRLRVFMDIPNQLLHLATRLDRGNGLRMYADWFTDAEKARPSVVSTALARCLADWHRAMAPVLPILDSASIRHPLVCQLADSRWAGLFHNRAPNDERVPAFFIGGVETFRQTVAERFPISAPLVFQMLSARLVLAGGAVLDAIQSPLLRRWLPDSDLDLWAVGADDREQLETQLWAVRTLLQFLPKGTSIQLSGTAVTLCVPGACRTERVQVLLSRCATALELVQEFDLDYVSAYYAGGSDLFATWACVAACVCRTTALNVDLGGVTPDRLAKARAKGFSTLLNDTPTSSKPRPLYSVDAPRDEYADFDSLSRDLRSAAGGLWRVAAAADEVKPMLKAPKVWASSSSITAHHLVLRDFVNPVFFQMPPLIARANVTDREKKDIKAIDVKDDGQRPAVTEFVDLLQTISAKRPRFLSRKV